MSYAPFESALAALKGGERVARAGWNGKGMYLFLLTHVPARIMPPMPVSAYRGAELPPAAVQTYYLEPFICMKTADYKMVPWLASQTDILAKDWEIVQ